MHAENYRKYLEDHRRAKETIEEGVVHSGAPAPQIGLAPEGRMRQEVYEDTLGMGAWDLDQGSRCFVAIANSKPWMGVIGERPPTGCLPASVAYDAGRPPHT